MRFGSVVMGAISAALFGIATPLSKILLATLSQFQLAGLLCLGAGAAMLPVVVLQRRESGPKRVDRKNAVRLGMAVLFGGCLGPVCLLLGLASAHAASVSPWLNLELAATAVLGFLLFKDHLDVLGWLGVGGALAAGVLVTIAVGRLPAPGVGLASLALGAVCYGGSIVLFISAAQRVGAARGQILFASAPFFGMLFAFLLLAESLSWLQAAAAVVLLCSIALMLRARHSHRHLHEHVVHVHAHRHDDQHHTHLHPGAPVSLTHTHEHSHEAIEHEHGHVPDLHHRHNH
jgi:drug/metabolite transporter (DMT)-like permease